jgi:hypothetical protein
MALELEIDNATQYATLYADGKPIATIARRRVYETGPVWRAFDLNGVEIHRSYSNPPASILANRIAKKLGV